MGDKCNGIRTHWEIKSEIQSEKEMKEKRQLKQSLERNYPGII